MAKKDKINNPNELPNGHSKLPLAYKNEDNINNNGYNTADNIALINDKKLNVIPLLPPPDNFNKLFQNKNLIIKSKKGLFNNNSNKKKIIKKSTDCRIYPEICKDNEYCNEFNGKCILKPKKTNKKKKKIKKILGKLEKIENFNNNPLKINEVENIIKPQKIDTFKIPKKIKTIRKGVIEVLPNIDDPFFYQKIKEYFIGKTGPKDLTIPPFKDKSRHGCRTVSKMEVNPHQEIVAKFMKPNNPFRGILVWHSLGSGKTLLSLAVINEYLLNKPDFKIYVITPPGLKGNFSEEALKFPYLYGKKMDIDEKKRKIAEDIRVISYITAANKLSGAYDDSIGGKKRIEKDSDKNPSFENSLIVIDEAHNLSDDTFPYRKDLDIIKKAIRRAKNVKVLLMTATPIVKKISEIIVLLNLLKKDNFFKEKFDGADKADENDKIFYENYISYNEIGEPFLKEKNDFIKKVKGLVSYYNVENDTSIFPRKKFQPNQEAEMSEYQYKQWREARLKEKKQEEKEGDDFEFSKTRKISDFPIAASYKNRINDSVKNLEKYSPKVNLLISNLEKKENNGKHSLYSFWKTNGINSIAAALRYKGWTEYSDLDFYKGKKRDKILADISSFPDLDKSFTILHSELTQQAEKMILKGFNSEANSNGKKIKLILLDKKYREGISLQAVKHAHIFEPQMTISELQQVIGRSVRTCSHKSLPYPKDWIVKVYQYYSVKKERIDGSTDATTDYLVSYAAQKKEHIKNLVLQVLKDSAIDCQTNKNRADEGTVCINDKDFSKSKKKTDPMMEIDSNFLKDFGKVKKPREEILCNLLNDDECIISKWCYLDKTGTCVNLSSDIECSDLDNSKEDCHRLSKCKWFQNSNSLGGKCMNLYSEEFKNTKFGITFKNNEESKVFRLKDITQNIAVKLRNELIEKLLTVKTTQELLDILEEVQVLIKNYHEYIDDDELIEILNTFKNTKSDIWNPVVLKKYKLLLTFIENFDKKTGIYYPKIENFTEHNKIIKSEPKLNLFARIDDNAILLEKNDSIHYIYKFTYNNNEYYVDSSDGNNRFISKFDIETSKNIIQKNIISDGFFIILIFNLSNNSIYSVQSEIIVRDYEKISFNLEDKNKKNNTNIVILKKKTKKNPKKINENAKKINENIKKNENAKKINENITKKKYVKSIEKTTCTKRNPQPPCVDGFKVKKNKKGEDCCYKNSVEKKTTKKTSKFNNGKTTTCTKRNPQPPCLDGLKVKKNKKGEECCYKT